MTGRPRTVRRGRSARLAPGIPVDAEAALRIDGPPVGKGRPRFDGREIERADGTVVHGRTFTPAATVRGENRVQLAWIEAGRPRLPDGPIVLRMEIVLERPRSHWRLDGTLSAAGERAPWPTSRPDLDNVLKLVADALNGHAYRDDAAIVDAHVVRRWANPGEVEHVAVRLAPAPVTGLRGLAARVLGRAL